MLHSSTLDYSNSQFAQVSERVLTARIIREMEKFRWKKFHFTFQRTMPLICAHLLISSPFLHYSPVFYLPVSTANRFSIWLSSLPPPPPLNPEVFAFLFQRRVTAEKGVIFKMPEKTMASFFVPFLSILSSSTAALFRPFHPVVHILILSRWEGFVLLDEIRVSFGEKIWRRRKLSLFSHEKMAGQRMRSYRDVNSRHKWSRRWD